MRSGQPRTTLELRAAPHAHGGPGVEQIMRQVVYAILPLCAFSVYQFGLSAALLIAIVTATCLATEAGFARVARRSNPLGDGSAAITGLLLALTLPPGLPLWMGAVAGFIAIALGKVIFGGLGFNVFNPALVGRAFAQAAFPAALTTWTPSLTEGRFQTIIPSTLAWPLMQPADVSVWAKSVAVDAFTGATPLASFKFDGQLTGAMQLLWGTPAGSAGEGSAVLILACGGYLALRRMLDWRIPAAILASAFALAAVLHVIDAVRFPPPQFMLLSGGLLLGAVFMATDMVGSPVTPRGVWLFGFLIGTLTIVIRLFGGLSEGVMYAILIGNALAPLLDRWTQPRAYGIGGGRR